MEHECDKKKLIIIKEERLLTTYKCPACGKEFHELGEIVINNNESLVICQVYLKWSKDISSAAQINILKRLVLSIKNTNNVELLKYAKKSECMKVGDMYLSEAYELIAMGKKEGLTFFIQGK